MYWLHAQSYLQLQPSYKGLWIFRLVAIFKSQVLKVAANVMTVEFGTIHHYSSLFWPEGKFWSLFVQFFGQVQKLTEHYVN